MQQYRELLDYDANYICSLRRYNRFQVVFAPYWLGITDAANAPNVDLNFIKSLIAFREVDSELANAVLQTVFNHLDYLIPEMGFLSLFAKEVTEEEKELIAKAVLAEEFDGERVHSAP